MSARKLISPHSIGEQQENLFTIRKKGIRRLLAQRIEQFNTFLNRLLKNQEHTYQRLITSPTDREVTIWDPRTRKYRKMLMFAANNYLGLANHTYVRQRVSKAVNEYGVGVGGPPLLNGYTKLMQELEERIAALKHQEDAMIFSTGFLTNLGMIGGLVKEGDCVVFDRLSHASFYDAQKLSPGKAIRFEHNDLEDLERKLSGTLFNSVNRFVGIEGVYSMDGDLAPLDQIVPLCKIYGAHIMLDDAHGTGVLGNVSGSGTAEHFGVEREIDMSMGTFSKVFAVTGGFLAAPRELINYLRHAARSYIFSASLPPMILSAVLAGLDIMEKEPERRHRLMEISNYAKRRLSGFSFYAKPGAAIFAITVPPLLEIRKAAYKIHECGIFLNAIEFPAVPVDKPRFRISLMSEHTKEDIDRLASCLEEIWYENC